MTVPKSDRGPMLDEWRRHLEVLNHEVFRAMVHRQVWTETRDAIVSRHPESDGTFLHLFGEMYAHSQAMFVRRLADRDRSSRSLWTLVEHIRRNPGLVSRADYVGTEGRHFGPDNSVENDIGEKRADEGWRQSFGELDHPDPLLLADYQKQLRDTAVKVTNFADRRVAHLDMRDPNDPTFGEIDDAVDALADELNRYNMLLNHTTVIHELHALPINWQECLRTSLFPLPLDRWGLDNVSFT